MVNQAVGAAQDPTTGQGQRSRCRLCGEADAIKPRTCAAHRKRPYTTPGGFRHRPIIGHMGRILKTSGVTGRRGAPSGPIHHLKAELYRQSAMHEHAQAHSGADGPCEVSYWRNGYVKLRPEPIGGRAFSNRPEPRSFTRARSASRSRCPLRTAQQRSRLRERASTVKLL